MKTGNTIRIVMSEQAIRMLRQLLSQGIYGMSLSVIAERIIDENLQARVKAGELPK